MRALYEGAAERIHDACHTLGRLEQTLDALVRDDDRRSRIYERTGGRELSRTLGRIGTWIDDTLKGGLAGEVVAPHALRDALRDEIELIGLEVRDR